MEKLPQEIAFEIFNRLPPESVVRCRFVCKSWCSLLTYGDGDGDGDDVNYFAYVHLRRRRHHDQERNLDYLTLNFIALHKEEGSAVVEFHNTEYDDEVEGLNCKVNRLVFSLNYISGWLSMTRLVESCNGLLCFIITYRNGTNQTLKDRIVICNPVLHEYVTLPLSDLQYHKHRRDRRPILNVVVITGFGHNPITDEYKVVRVYYRRQDSYYIGDVEVYTLGKSKSSSNGGATGMWRSKGTIEYRLRSGSRPVLINGSIHWLADTESEQNIVSFDLEDEEFRVMPLPSNLNITNMSIEQLKELRGCLCLIGRTRDIWVLKDYMNKESWVKEFSIKWEVGKKLYSPIAIKKKKKKKDGDGDAILCWRSRKSSTKRLVSYDPKTEKFEKVGGKQVVDELIIDSVFHINSLVSLKALGEDAKYAEEWLPRQGPWTRF